MCQYCDIVNGTSNVKKIYDDELAIAFLPFEASVPGEVIIIPKEHYQIMEQVPDDTIAHLSTLSKKLSDICFQLLSGKGVNILIQNGIPAGQEQPHFSIRILPRRDGDNANFMWAESTKQASQDELQSAHDILMSDAKNIHIANEKKTEVIQEETPKEIKKEEGEIDYRMDFFKRTP